MKHSETINELATALAKAQAQIRPAHKSSDNPFFKSKYADLAAVIDSYREPLAAQGLSLSQHPSSEGSKVVITSLLMHTSGQWLESDLALTADKPTPQSIGSSVTYGRRYAAMAILGMAADDDDGNAAEGRKTKADDEDDRFDPKNRKHQDWLIAQLRERKVPDDRWDDIAKAVAGKVSEDTKEFIRKLKF